MLNLVWLLQVSFNFSVENITVWKVSRYGVISGPYFPVFGLNIEIYSVILRIQSEYRKIRTRINSVFGHFSIENMFFTVVSWQKYIDLKIIWNSRALFYLNIIEKGIAQSLLLVFYCLLKIIKLFNKCCYLLFLLSIKHSEWWFV